jgi:4-hydroxybenzoate polyprenyltransferase
MEHAIPLVVDLDGTLLRSDLLVESGLAYVGAKPWLSFSPIKWLFSGRAHLKANLAKSAPIDVTTLPYDPEVIVLIKEEKAKGRSIILATGSHKIYADQIANHLQLFDRVLATEAGTNLSAHNKRDMLVQEYGEQGFDYVGNSRADLPVWAAARLAYLVNPELGVESSANALGNVERVIRVQHSKLHSWMTALRFHQWIKNLLIFIPLLASHQLDNPSLLLTGLLAYILFGFCASSVYLLNDLLDLADDRYHPKKRYRPFAAGDLSVKAGVLIFPFLLLLAFSGAILLMPWYFTVTLAIYYLLTLAYSFALKKVMILDVIILAMLYTLRIIAGALAFNMLPTFWMLAFSMFIFLSLALVKRYAELLEAKNKGETTKTPGRGYYPNDLEMIASLGASSGYLSVMVLALYIQDQSTINLYQHPAILWLGCPLLLFWISRIWLLAHRGQMHEDPIVFAIKDKTSLILGVLFCIIFGLAV